VIDINKIENIGNMSRNKISFIGLTIYTKIECQTINYKKKKERKYKKII
jgi:hypothetical protein